MKSPKLITFEGGDGSGKSTQALMLAARLEAAGIGAVLTREPGGGSLTAEIIRHVLLSGAVKPFGADAEALLFAIARGDHVRNIIGPALARGIWVVCDRFIDSTRVYQGGGSHDFICALEQAAVGERKPDLTFVLDVPAEIGLARARARRGEQSVDRFESEPLAYHETLREAYRRLVAAEPGRCIAIDATAPKTAVAARVWEIVTERMISRRASVATAEEA